jgi:hypothetical protein
MKLTARKSACLVLPNPRLVPRLARHYRGQGLDYLDLKAAGRLSLVEAAVSYKPSFGIGFRPYAVREIKRTLARSVKEAEAQACISAPRLIDVGPEQHAINRERLAARLMDKEHGVNSRLIPSVAETAKIVAAFGRPDAQCVSGLNETIRNIIMYLTRKLMPRLSHDEIGAPFQLRHSVVVKGIDSVGARCRWFPAFRSYIQGLLQTCGAWKEMGSTKD